MVMMDDIPRRKHHMPPINIRVLAYDLDDEDNPVRNRVIDFRDRGHREWFQQFLMWAMTNKKAVEIVNVKDE
jgi:hypothetical protein